MRNGRLVRWSLVVAVVAVTSCFFPLFRFVRTSDAPAEKISSATEYLEQLWTRELPAAHERAVAVDELIAALDAKPPFGPELGAEGQVGAEKYGRKVGLSDTQYYFARGAGMITELSENRALVRVGSERLVCLKLGVLTGSAVRDATGLVDVSRFARLQDYNALSGQLNERVEVEVISPLREQLAVGARVEFIGCAQVKTKRDLEPLCFVPIALKVVAEGAP